MRTLLAGDELKEHPHPALKMYLGCAKWSRPEQRVLPWSGGWLDWDFQETREYEWLEELVEEEKSAIEKRKKALEKAKDFYSSFGGSGA